MAVFYPAGGPGLVGDCPPPLLALSEEKKVDPWVIELWPSPSSPSSYLLSSTILLCYKSNFLMKEENETITFCGHRQFISFFSLYVLFKIRSIPFESLKSIIMYSPMCTILNSLYYSRVE
jgi:hypothetical protein